VSDQSSKKIALILPLIIFLALIPLFFFALYEEKEEIPSPLVGKQVPDFLIADLSGEQLLDRSQLLGEPFILNVWGSWCPSCYVEHEHLTMLSEQGVRIIGLNYKDKRNKALNFLEKLGNPYYLVIFDEKGELGLELGVYGAPESYLVDAEGMIVHKKVGVLDERVWREQFEKSWRKLSNRSETGVN